jgi:glycosyltransferase involved in cell wall biosynthesis
MKVAVVIPCYRVSRHVLQVIAGIGPEVHTILVVDDGCPEGSGALVEQRCRDARVRVLFREHNGGVGAATLAGFEEAERTGHDIVVKVDGDGQMDPRLIPTLIRPLVEGRADFAKGNRFFSPRNLRTMPGLRLVGNSGISFLAKLANGYWHVMDPTNGFIAMRTVLLPVIDHERISNRYFFENDLLFRLSLVRASVVDVPMAARYGDERSNLSAFHSLVSFPARFLWRFGVRIAYRYFLRDFNVGSVSLLTSLVLLLGGAGLGVWHWVRSVQTGVPASSGTVMLAALPVLLGFQLLTFALLYDVETTPREPISPYLAQSRPVGVASAVAARDEVA